MEAEASTWSQWLEAIRDSESKTCSGLGLECGLSGSQRYPERYTAEV